MSSVEKFENFTSSIYSKIVEEQDNVTMNLVENYVKEKQRCGEICLLNLIGEGKIRHIFNLGITAFNELQKEPEKVLARNYFPESVYVEHLLNVIKHLEQKNYELRIQLNDNHIPHID